MCFPPHVFRVFVIYVERARRNGSIYIAFNWSEFLFTSLWLDMFVCVMRDRHQGNTEALICECLVDFVRLPELTRNWLFSFLFWSAAFAWLDIWKVCFGWVDIYGMKDFR